LFRSGLGWSREAEGDEALAGVFAVVLDFESGGAKRGSQEV
jgi:hypothetical protein